uniref:peptidylprolyl isomerase n=1 Tax=Kalanchoe fedtschenkoi TaxID=63787 RepID=A0A7N0V1Z0_KALFE
MELLILPHQQLKPSSNPLLRIPPLSAVPGKRSLKWRNNHTCTCTISSANDENPIEAVPLGSFQRRAFLTSLVAGAAAISTSNDEAGAVSKRALRGAKIPETEYTTLPNGLKYYDLKVGSGPVAVKGSRVAIHYVAKWRNITFMTSRQGMGVGGGTPYGFDVGESKRGLVLKGLDLGVEGMRVGGQRLLIVPPELAYGSKGVQEIPPNATIEFDVELLSIKQTPFGSPVKIVEG